MKKPNFRRNLTEKEMQSVLSQIEQSDSVDIAILAVYRCLDPEFDSRDSVRPQDYAIPGKQTKQILGAAQDRANKLGIDGNVNLFWMNVGPSCLDPA